MRKSPLLAVLAFVTASSTLLSACVPVVIGAAVAGTALVVADRRSVGAQADDEAIELKISNNVGSTFGDRVHVSVTSYNGIVLLTGEVPTAELKAQVEQVARTTAKVRRVDDELAIGAVTSIGARSNDAYITSKVKARLVESNKVPANLVKVVTERQIVYLMGILSHAEADAAAQIAATTSGVMRVVKVFEYTD
ncbi:MAG TPA: BON domain-containing protein [Casimicrobiaceae bacterium]|jgi:osmotically-inducible protein OsmY|nr:BON domain-containing protein [Casimicrobiaceae bacterium]